MPRALQALSETGEVVALRHLSHLRRPKGFILECLVAKHMEYRDAAYETLFVELLEAIRDAYSLHILLKRVPFLEDLGCLATMFSPT